MDSFICDSLWVFLLIILPTFSITPEAVGFKITLMVTAELNKWFMLYCDRTIL